MPRRRPLPRTFFARDTATVARDLLGATLWTESGGILCAGRVVETEAYLDHRDPASHAAGGPTQRSAIMFGPPATAYVYLSYGMHHCLNCVTETAGTAGAVLLRALEPLTGIETMIRRRGDAGAAAPASTLCAGPGRLCRALGIDLAWNGLPLTNRRQKPANIPWPCRVWFAAGPAPERVACGPRIGIRRAADRPLRYCDPGSPSLSRRPSR